MQLGFLGRRTLVLVALALGGGCAQAVTGPVVPVAKVPGSSASVFVPPAISACPLDRSGVVWLPGAGQLLTYCDNMVELRDLGGAVLAQRLLSAPAAWQDRFQAAAISPDGSRLALAFYHHVEVRHLPSLALLWSADVPPNSTFLGFSTGGKQLRVSEGTSTLAFAIADGQRVEPTPPAVAKRWQESYSLNADDTLAFQVEDSKLTVWDPKKDVAIQSFEMPNGVSGSPVWIGPYLGLHLSKECLLVDARDPQRRFRLNGDSPLEQVALSKDGARLRSYRQGDLVEWRLGDAEPVVLESGSPDRIWLGPAGTRAEVRRESVTISRLGPAGKRVAQRVWAHPSWLEFGTAGEVVMDDSLQPRLLVLGTTSAPREIALSGSERPGLLAFEPTGGRFVMAAGRNLRIYRLPALDLQQTIELPFAPSALGWRAEPAQLLVADEQQLYSVALADGKVTRLDDFSSVERIAVSPDGKTVAIAELRRGSHDVTLLTRAASEHQPLNDALRDLRFSPDGKALWALEPGSLLTVQLSLPLSAAERVTRKAIKGEGWQTSLTPTGDVFCMAERLRFANENGELEPEPEPVAVQPAWSGQGLTLTSNAPSAPALVAFPAGTVILPPTPKVPSKSPEMPQIPLVSGDARAWAVNADGSVLATLDGNSAVNTFSTSGGLRARLAESALALISSEDASHVVVVAADARSLTLWNTQTWKPRVELPIAEGISQIAVSKDGARVAVLDESGALQVVFADRSLHRYVLRTDMGVRGLAFDPSGNYLALGGLPLRIMRLSDGVVIYGYMARVEVKHPVIAAWVLDSGAFVGDSRALPNAAGLASRQTPSLLKTFFGPSYG